MMLSTPSTTLLQANIRPQTSDIRYQRETLCVHAGKGPDPLTGAVMTPIYLTSTYAQRAPGEHKGFEYSRTSNPTRLVLEMALAQLEGGLFACAFASGLAAEDAILHLLGPGDEVLVCRDLYGGTHRLMTKIWQRYGLVFKFIDTTCLENVSTGLTKKTKMVWLETPSNPLLRITDISAVNRMVKAHSKDVLVVVDNTFATPIIQQPLSLGADCVIHSMTKYLGGHSDIIGGAVITRKATLHEKIKFHQNALGAVPSPVDAFLALRGIKTLALRMATHSANGLGIAKCLTNHPGVLKVLYPGLPAHPNYEVAKKQMKDFGGMVSFEIKGGERAAKKFLSSLRVFTLGESLGGVESLANYPAIMTHASIPAQERLSMGITPGLIRLSVGIEGLSDLRHDLEEAFGSLRKL